MTKMTKRLIGTNEVNTGRNITNKSSERSYDDRLLIYPSRKIQLANVLY